LFGQGHPVSGKVTDESGIPLSKVNIIICGEMRSGTSSNEEGNFNIYCKSGDTLQFSHLGYETFKVRAEEKLWQPDQPGLRIILKPIFLNLKQFTVTDKRDRSLKYLLDFDVVQGHILKLEIRGSKKVLFLYDMNDREYWRCLLPEHAMDCSRLTRDFVNNVYLQSRDSIYQLYITTKTCQLLPGVSNQVFHARLDPCLGSLSTGILLRRYGPYKQSIVLSIADRYKRKKIYEQEDRLAYLHCKDLNNAGPLHAGLGFEVIIPEMKTLPAASLYRQHIPKGIGAAAGGKGIIKPINVESVCIGDSILIFDHTINKILVMNPEGKLLSSTSIFYNNKEFQQKYIVDDYNLSVAGVFKNRKGIYLQSIDPFSGKPVGKARELDCLFLEKVRMVDGIAVYLSYDHVRNKRTLVKSSVLWSL
jgi:hypothetical protein